MNKLKQILSSSVTRKFIMSLTGLALVLFTITHLLGNMLLYKKDPALFNSYAAKLESYGVLLEIAEIGLLVTFLIHVFSAIGLRFKNKKARSIDYSMIKSKGGPTRNNLSSRNMIISGGILLAFLVIHLRQFKFGGAATTPELAASLYSQVASVFHNPAYVVFYMACMITLGLHLRHGFWSAFQSLGATNASLDKPIKLLGGFIAAALTIGFLGIPLWMYFDRGSL